VSPERKIITQSTSQECPNTWIKRTELGDDMTDEGAMQWTIQDVGMEPASYYKE